MRFCYVEGSTRESSMFSVTEAAFSGFRAARENPRAVLVWFAVASAVLFGVTILVVAMAGPVLPQFMEIAFQPQPDEATAQAVAQQIAPLVMILVPTMWLINAIAQAVVCRVVLRPDAGQGAFLRLGREEWLQLGVVVASYLILTAVDLVFRGVGSALGPFGVLLGGAGLVLHVVIAVKLSLASAITFDTGRIGLAASWRLTTGRFWPLLGAYALAIVLAVIVLVAVTAIFAAASLLVPGADATEAPAIATVPALFTPLQIVAAVFAGVMVVLAGLIVFCPAAEIYRRLKAAGQVPTAS